MGRVAKLATGATALVLVLTGAGCGSMSPKARYVSKLNAMCEDFAKREQKIGAPGTPGDLKARGDRIVAAYEQAILIPIERLKAPPEIAPQAARLRELARRQRDLLRGLTAAGKAGDIQKVQRLAVLNQQVNAQAAQVARNLKARSCSG